MPQREFLLLSFLSLVVVDSETVGPLKPIWLLKKRFVSLSVGTAMSPVLKLNRLYLVEYLVRQHPLHVRVRLMHKMKN